MNLNVDSWKEFIIKDLFTVELSKGDIKYDEMDKGEIPLVSSGETNNGIVGFIDAKGDGKAEMFPGNRITIDMFGNAFYQNKPFYAVSHGRVNILSPRFEMNRGIGQFIVSVINQQLYKYSYGRAVYSSVAEEMEIKLPVTSSDEPDWNFMNEYIKALHYKPLTTKNKKNDVSKINVQNWREFRVGDYFEVFTGGDMWLDEEQSGTIPVICLGAENNGVCGYIGYNSKHRLYPGNSISVAGWAGGLFAFYQDKDFYVKGRLKVLVPKFDNNRYISLFLCTMLNKEDYRYSYGRKASAEHVPNTIIKLPSTISGEPDWKFMEDYIKSLPYGDRL